MLGMIPNDRRSVVGGRWLSGRAASRYCRAEAPARRRMAAAARKGLRALPTLPTSNARRARPKSAASAKCCITKDIPHYSEVDRIQYPTANHAKRGRQRTCPATAGCPISKATEGFQSLAHIIHEQSTASTNSATSTGRNAGVPHHSMFNTAHAARPHFAQSWQHSSRSRDEGS